MVLCPLEPAPTWYLAEMVPGKDGCMTEVLNGNVICQYVTLLEVFGMHVYSQEGRAAKNIDTF